MGKSIESLEEFYQHKLTSATEGVRKDNDQFNIFNIEENIITGTTSPSYIRRNFYKIMLFKGKNVFHYSDKSIPIEGDTLLFFDPKTPYTYDSLEPDSKGWFCVFKQEFFQTSLRINLNELPLFSKENHPVFKVNSEESEEIEAIFKKISKTADKDYVYKYELIKSYVSELIYLAMQLHPSEEVSGQSDSSSRITAIFNELLDRQFPIDSKTQRFELRSPKLIADQLSIHVNSLNRAIKNTTGLTTTDHIFEKLTAEAKALLKHTDWNIAEISYALGFEDQAHFNHFFKKHTHINPSAFRQV
ncbi:AraC family transcriptional regulator [Chryseobacterium sp. T16E-39]|uniref:helix-turn-helix domain-containing protein n=1 Tax=Chryseobacterium sp. T16E-39 TaxID=2015076 RepID=UPI000B5B3601|nr:helix-turn-helix domain-containing protein [Chryseobacterium sp. T16E-39]ASK29324.1 AraC family transcriptional regulator [Chryseobacterium sp. T16E-39]